jgi:hypothetical protein
MKQLLTVVFALLVTTLYSQSYMDKIVKNSCDCIATISDTLDNTEYTQKLGLCMMTAAEPYRKQLKKDHNIDFNNIDRDGYRLGTLIGTKMAGVCPEFIVAASKRTRSKNTDGTAEEEFEGIVTKVEKDFFVSISVRDEEGRTSKFYWLTFVQSNYELIEKYESLVGKSVGLVFSNREYFDPKIGEYRKFAVIKELEVFN